MRRRRRKWIELTERCRLPKHITKHVFREIAGATDEAIDASLLPSEMKKAYKQLIRVRSAGFAR